MTDVRSGLIERRVCGGIEVGFGVLLVLGAILSVAQSGGSILSILGALYIILTGSLGIASNKKGLVIAYMVTGIICAVLLAIVTIFLVIALVSAVELYNSDVVPFDTDTESAVLGILIASLVIEFLAFIVAVLGVIFAGLPLCGNIQDEQFNYTTFQGNAPPPSGTVAPPSYDNTAYPDAKQLGPVSAPPSYDNSAYPGTKQGPV